MQQGGQGSEGRHPSSPRGGSSAASNSSMSKFSLLGQQLTNFGSAQQQQQQQQQHHHPNHQHPSNSNSANMNFSLGVPSHGQPFSQGHQQQAPQSQPNGNNGGGDGAGFSNMQNVNSMVGAGQNFNQSHPFLNQQMLQQTSGGVPDFLKINQQQAPQPVQSAPSLGMTGSGGVSPESLMTALATIQQKILQLQAMVPYMAQNQQLPNVAFQQQAAAAISQIAQVAANMFPAPQSQQQQNIPCAPQSPITDPQQQQQQQQLSQLFGASVPPGFNFFQQSGAAPLNNTSGGNSGLGNNFVPLQGGGSGVTIDMGPSASSLASQIVAIDGGVSGNSSSGAGTGLGNAPKSTPSVGGQNFGGGQVGASNVSSAATNMNSGLVGRNKHGSPRSNQMGTGPNRGGAAAGMTGDMSHMSNNRSAINSGGMTTSPVDDHDVGGTGSRDEDDDGDAENLLPGSYDLVEMEAIEILAEHTHFCEICGKGFKRDANLRMHMRGHGDEYKTPAALARPDRAAHEMTVIRPRRFSCPYVGCKRNKKHRKFQPLKTMLCVKNHYRRSHCPKILTCNKCKTKKFSVVADLKTHEKHCGCDKWQCSCGTTFSRKDKLLGHIGLFQGHTPAMPFNDVDSSGGMDVSDMGGGPGNPSTMPNSGNNSSGYGLSSGGNLNSGSASSMGLGGGSGMGLAGNGLQGMSSQGGTPGGGGMNMPKDGNVLGPENSSSSDSFPSAGNLLPGSAMLQSLFTANFLQSTSGGNSSSDGLH